jgi:hypothetical protein
LGARRGGIRKDACSSSCVRDVEANRGRGLGRLRTQLVTGARSGRCAKDNLGERYVGVKPRKKAVRRNEYAQMIAQSCNSGGNGNVGSCECWIVDVCSLAGVVHSSKCLDERCWVGRRRRLQRRSVISEAGYLHRMRSDQAGLAACGAVRDFWSNA